MAIPIADLQKQIQTPQVAKGQALDLSGNVKAAFSPALNTLDNMEKFSNVWAKAAYVQERSEDQFKAEQASLKYMEKANELNKQLSTKQGADALKFKDKYYSELTKAQEVFLGELTSLRHADIRENARDGVNKFNLSNSANQEMYFYKQDELVKDNTSEAVKNTAMNAALSSVSPFLKAEENITAFNNALQAGADSLANRLIAKGTPKELITLQVQQYKAKAAKLAAERLAADSRSFGFLTGYKSSLDFINSLGAEIDTQDKIALLKEFEQKQLDYEFKRNPSAFTTADNKFNEHLAATISPNLTPFERLKTIKVSETGKKNGLSSEGTTVATSLANRLTNNFFNTLSSLGLIPESEITQFRKDILAVGGKDAQKALATRLVDNFKNKGTLAAAIHLFADYKNLAKAQYVINTETGDEIDTTNMSQAQIEQLKASGKVEFVNDIFSYATGLKNGAIDIQEIMEPVISQLVTEYEGKSGLKTGWFHGRKLNVEEQAALAFTKTLYDISGRDFSKVSPLVILEAQEYFLNNFDAMMEEEIEEGKNTIRKTRVNLEKDAQELFEDTKKRKFVMRDKDGKVSLVEKTYADRLRELMAASLNSCMPKELMPKAQGYYDNWGPQDFQQKSHFAKGWEGVVYYSENVVM